MNIENELNKVMEIFNRAKFEQVNKDITDAMRIVWKKVDGKIIRFENLTQKGSCELVSCSGQILLEEKK